MRKSLLVAGICSGLFFSGSLFAAGAAEEVGVQDAYVRAVPPGQPNGAAFLVLSNGGAGAHALVGAASPVSEVVELHTHTQEGGMMKMRRVERIDLPAGESVSLQPGGLHLMLIGLKQQLQPGEHVDLKLVFEDKSSQQIQVPVREIEPPKMQDDMHRHMKH